MPRKKCIGIGSKILFIFVVLLSFLTLPSFVYAEDITDSIYCKKSRGTYDRRSGEYSFDVYLENISAQSFAQPIYAVVKNISSDLVTDLSGDGSDADGNPWHDYSGYLGDGVLGPGETSQPKRWVFSNPNNVRFSYDVQILAGGVSGDEDPPLIAITNPINAGAISNASPYVTIVYSDAGSGINPNSLEVQINGVDSTNLFDVSESKASHRLSWSLSSGPHQIYASIRDNEGNEASALCNFTVVASNASLQYLFSLKGNDWIFASPGDGTYVEFASPADLGVEIISDLVSVSRPYPAGHLFFSNKDTGGILQSSLNGMFIAYMQNYEMGLTDEARIASNFVDLDGSVVFSVDGAPDIYQSFGTGSFQSFIQNNELGIGSADQVECLHIGYDNTTYFCYSGNEGVYQSFNDGAFSQFLTSAALGATGASLDAFAILPETTSPSLSITYPPDGAFINTVTPNISVTFQDYESGIDTSTFFAQLNGTDVSNAFSVTSSGATYQVPTNDPLPVGNNSLLVRISDRATNEASVTSNFTTGILRAIPGATPTSGAAPLKVRFTTDGEDPSGTIEIFRWDFDGDGTWDTYDTVARDYDRTYNTPGTYIATLYVKSSTGETATESVTITVENNPPTATADVVPSNGEVPLTVTMYGSGSDTDGSIVLYEWDFEGDGTYDWSSTTTGNTTHTYSTVGTFQAVFRVTDNSGLAATAVAATTTVRAGPPGSPTATAAGSPTSGNSPLTVNFNGSATDPDNDIILYEWDFDGDGVYDWSSPTSGSTSHIYTTGGTHLAVFRATDSTGLNGIDQILITVNLQASLSVQKDTVGWLTNVSEKTASASSSNYPPSYAIDGDTNTFWYTQYGDTANSWFEINYSKPQVIKGLTITWYWAPYYYNITRGRIDIFDNSGSLLYSQEADLQGEISTIDLPDVQNATKIRLSAISTYRTDYVVIREFEVESAPMPSQGEPEPGGTNIITSISAGSPVTIFIKDESGNVVRNIVNNLYRDLGSYSDYWDCRDNAGVVVNDGLYYAVMQYIVNGQVKVLDLTQTTGGTRSDFPISTGCNTRSGTWTENFSPFDDEQVGFQFTLCSAQEVTFFIGPLWTGADATRVRTILNRQPFPAGTHTIYWDGLDDNGNIAQAPAGDDLITGAWRYSLPNNAIFMTGGTPKISNISAEPNYFSPFSEKCDENGNGEGVIVSYSVSEDVASVELRVYSIETGSVLRTLNNGSASAGDNIIFWDGKNNNGEYVDIGDYRIGVMLTDSQGNSSLFRYTLARIDY